jgi:nucleotide-binding universal stress UspA family protein
MTGLWKHRLILCPTDFAPPAAVAFELACSLARDQRARVVVLHVMPPPAMYGEAVVPPLDNEQREEMRDRLHAVQPADPAVDVEYRLEEGDPAVVIGDTADRLGCDLIVMGTHGRSGLGRLFLGSVAEKVLRESNRPVLTVKAPPPAAGSGTDAAELAVAAGR